MTKPTEYTYVIFLNYWLVYSCMEAIIDHLQMKCVLENADDGLVDH